MHFDRNFWNCIAKRSSFSLGIDINFQLNIPIFFLGFKNLDHLAAFIGLVPDIEASGEKTNIKGLTKRYQKYLRSLLIEAAWIASANDPALTLALSNLCKKKIKQKAIIKITKKLVNRLRSVWINQQEYVYAVVQ